MSDTSRPEELHVRITRLYFRLLLPLSSIAVTLAAVETTPTGQKILLPLALLSLVYSLLHWIGPGRYEPFLRLTFVSALTGFVGLVALLGMFVPLPGDGTQMIVVYLFAPITVFAWGFLFFDRPRQGQAWSLALSLASTALLWRWNVQGVHASSVAPPMLLLIHLIVMYYNSLILDLNRQFILGQQALRLDSLTGLLNRRAFDEHSCREGAPCYVAVLDIDNFKRVNDTYGHPAGDRVLRAVGDVLLDKLNGRGEAYRWGGEEFVILIPQTAIPEFLRWLEGVRAEIARRSFVDDQHVTLSAGVSMTAEGQSPMHAAFAEADAALLRAKSQGRNQTVVHPSASDVVAVMALATGS